jgi:hypothetical protein
MTPKRNAQHAGLDAAAHPDPGPQLRRSPRNLSVEESVASPSPLAKRLRGRSSKNAPPAELQVKKAVAKGPANESIANDDAEKDLNGMEDDAYSEHSVDTEDGNDTETSAPGRMMRITLLSNYTERMQTALMLMASPERTQRTKISRLVTRSFSSSVKPYNKLLRPRRTAV